MPTVAEVLNRGLDMHRQGHLDRAEAVYRQVLDFDARQPDALHLLGQIARARGHLDESVRSIRAAIDSDGVRAIFHVSLANALMEQGRPGHALDSYSRAVALDPGFADAVASLGAAASQLAEHARAATLWERAVELEPKRPEFLVGLGRSLRFAGRLEEAIAVLERALACGAETRTTLELLALVHRARFDYAAAVTAYRRALALAPDDVELLMQLGNVLIDQGRVEQAIDAFQALRELRPMWPLPSFMLARALRQRRQARDAVASLHRALALDPASAEGHTELGALQQSQGELAAAICHSEAAYALDPNQLAALSNVGYLMYVAGRFADALGCYDRVIAQRPEFANLHLNRALALRGLGRIAQAVQSFQCALALEPGNAEACNNLGTEAQALGDYGEAVRYYRLALALRPDYATAHSNLLFCMNYDDEVDSDTLFAEYGRWEALHARPHYASIRPHRNDRNPDRRLRIGYLSADFIHHPIATNTIGLLERHDRAEVEITCYAEVSRPDRFTRRFQAAADRWRTTVGVSDDDVAELIRNDQIDILVSMAGHTAGNRLTVCARKPAPIQVSYGDLSTTGLSTMDYWLTDAVIHPADTRERFTEELVRLPMLVLHEPPADAPPVAPLPAGRTGRITFGSFNNPAKLTPAVLATWAQVLHAVPGARLVLGYMNVLDDDVHRRRLIERFAAHGIGAGSVETLGIAFERADHLARMADVDIALDPFPFNGCTSTFEALWMGLPVVTLAGRRWLGRMGTSFLSTAGMTEWIARDRPGYVATAVRLAGDIDALARIRAGLRQRIARSPLCDAPAYARSVEQAYRAVWRRWCRADHR